MTLFATLAAASAGVSGADDERGSASAATDPSPSSLSGGGSGSSSRPPTAVQLYAGASVDFLTGTIRSDDTSDPRSQQSNGGESPRRGSVDGGSTKGLGGTPARRKFEVLSYQAVEAADPSSASSVEAGDKDLVRLPGSIQTRRGMKKHTRPNLGVWDCRLGRPDGSVAGGGDGEKSEGGKDEKGESDLIDRLLSASIPPSDDKAATPTFVLAIDLADPSLVYLAVSAMINSIVRRFDGAEPGSGSSGATKLSKLRGSAFGAAPSSDSTSPMVPASKDVGLNLVVAVLVPVARGGKRVPMFKEKQAQSLALYHLHRLAERADCTLAFVRPDGESAGVDGEGAAVEGMETAAAKSMPSITVSELAWAVRRVAMGLPPLDEAAAEKDGEGQTTDAESGDDAKVEENGTAGASPSEEALSSLLPPLLPPGSHDPDLIESALLRNASCPGEWDASTDDLWKALPPSFSGAAHVAPSVSPSKQKKKTAGGGGDQAWLAELAEGLNTATAGVADDISTATSVVSGGTERSSVAKSAKKKPAAKKRDKSVKGSADKKEGGAKAADPSAFFADLLKK